MKHKFRVFTLIIILGVACKSPVRKDGPKLENGVSLSLTAYRKAVIKNVHYTLYFDIPAGKEQEIAAKETLAFYRKDSTETPLQIDFKTQGSGLQQMIVNGEPIMPNFQKEHLLVDAKYLKQGDNTIEFSFTAGDAALNRRDNFLYTLFVPDRARTMFPCFDQPDLKATFLLTITVPEVWNAIANGVLKDSVIANGRKTYHFADSDTLSTYLFAFVAGKFNQVSEDLLGKNAILLYRETDTAKIQKSLPDIFAISKNALNYYQDWTGIGYPFQKFGMVAIPDFQFGGMEHPGTILYQSSSLFLDAGATRNQLNNRSNLLAHEIAHMWFGDLVTMKWFNDVWMKEVFANFMADKSTQSLTDKNDFDLKFLTDHYPAAYAVDRTRGANPIRQQLDNLQNAGMLYGNIIYNKAPIMMRQLELLMGKENFQKGVREYLHKYANSNASWPQLIDILDSYTPAGLKSWNEVWVNDPGRPVFDYSIKMKGNKIEHFTVLQSPEYGHGKIWPQTFDIAFFYRNNNKNITVHSSKAEQEITEAKGLDKPLYILFNASGIGYGVWPVDTAMEHYLYGIKQPVNRASAYITLYENMLNGRYHKPLDVLSLFISGLKSETSELNLKLLTGYIENIYWEYISKEERKKVVDGIETKTWQAMQQQVLPNNRKLLFQCYQNVFLSSQGRDRLRLIWQKQLAPNGVQLSEDDYTSLALALALRDTTNQQLLQEQLERIKNPDRKERFRTIMQAASSDVDVRNAFFKGLSKKVNRSNESAVTAALYYLHHPLRQSVSVKYLKKSLALLSEIQETGDIFFPQSWLQATFGYYQSKEAAEIVSDFLRNNPDYNPKLKEKILQATDPLMRAQKLVSVMR